MHVSMLLETEGVREEVRESLEGGNKNKNPTQ